MNAKEICVIGKDGKPINVFVVRKQKDIEKCRIVVNGGRIWKLRPHSSHVLTEIEDNVDGYFLHKKEINAALSLKRTE